MKLIFHLVFTILSCTALISAGRQGSSRRNKINDSKPLPCGPDTLMIFADCQICHCPKSNRNAVCYRKPCDQRTKPIGTCPIASLGMDNYELCQPGPQDQIFQPCGTDDDCPGPQLCCFDFCKRTYCTDPEPGSGPNNALAPSGNGPLPNSAMSSRRNGPGPSNAGGPRRNGLGPINDVGPGINGPGPNIPMVPGINGPGPNIPMGPGGPGPNIPMGPGGPGPNIPLGPGGPDPNIPLGPGGPGPNIPLGPGRNGRGPNMPMGQGRRG